MEIRWLEGFIAVAEELHFSNAAQRLGMAQSPLSQMIRRLETELGQKLFERSTRSVDLTAAGKAFLPHAREIVSTTAVAREAVNEAEGEIVGTVRIGFSGVLNYSTLPLLTSEVHKRLPNVELELVGQKLTKEAVSLLRLGALDITLMGLPIEDPEIETQLISVEGFCVVLSKNHRLAGEDVVDLADLSDEGFVTTPEFPGSVFRNSTFQLCAEAGFVPRISQQVNDPYMALLLVEVGVGVAVTTQSTGKLAPANTVTLPIKQCSVELRHGVAWMQGAGRVARDAVIDIALEIFNP